MNSRKQSFLERLTGAEHVSDTSDESNARVHLRSTSHPRAHVAYPDVEEVEDEFRAEYGSQDEDESPYEEEEEIEAGLAIDMYESDNELVIQSMIAGVTTEHLQITITRDTVTIRGKRIPPQGIPEERYMTRELYWGVFSREINLPYEIDTDGAEAVEKYGLLIIRLPRLDTNRMQELKVRSIQ
jgi:HSP20 family protein